MSVKNDIFWSELGSGFGELGGTPYTSTSNSQESPRVPDTKRAGLLMLITRPWHINRHREMGQPNAI